jgi:NTE family protein
MPSDLSGVMVRQKEIQYSSRTRANTDQFKQNQCVRVALANILEKIRPNSSTTRMAISCSPSRIAESTRSKDYDFSRVSMTEHWNAGYNDAMRTLRHPEALLRPTDSTGVATFDIAVDGRE